MRVCGLRKAGRDRAADRGRVMGVRRQVNKLTDNLHVSLSAPPPKLISTLTSTRPCKVASTFSKDLIIIQQVFAFLPIFEGQPKHNTAFAPLPLQRQGCMSVCLAVSASLSLSHVVPTCLIYGMSSLNAVLGYVLLPTCLIQDVVS